MSFRHNLSLFVTSTTGAILYWVVVVIASGVIGGLLGATWSILGAPWLLFINWIVGFAIGFYSVQAFYDLRDEGFAILRQKELDKL